MRKFLFYCIFQTFFLLISCSSNEDPNQTGNLKVVVNIYYGREVKVGLYHINAELDAEYYSDKMAIMIIESKKGVAEFNDILPGTYIFASVSNPHFNKKTVQIIGSKTITRNLDN
jgi:hypothetical protein